MKSKVKTIPIRTENETVLVLQVAPLFVPAAAAAALSAKQIAGLLGVSRRTFFGMVRKGEYPPADMVVSMSPRWSVVLHNEWMERHRKVGL